MPKTPDPSKPEREKMTHRSSGLPEVHADVGFLPRKTGLCVCHFERSASKSTLLERIKSAQSRNPGGPSLAMVTQGVLPGVCSKGRGRAMDRWPKALPL